jgi:hypothetical protein
MMKKLHSITTPWSKWRWITVSVILSFLAISLVGVAILPFSTWAQKKSETSESPTKSMNSSTPAATSAPAPTAPNQNSSSQTSKLEVVQSTVEVPPKGAATALLIMRNTSAIALNNIKITPLTDSNVSLVGTPSFEKKQSIVSKGEFAWTIKISNKCEDPATGSIIFRIDYTVAPVTTQAVPQVTFAVLQVRSHNVADVAEIKLETTLESLDQQHPGKLYLVITNKSDQSITVRKDKITWEKPSFIEIPQKGSEKKQPNETKEDGASFKLSPHQVGLIPFDVGTSSRVQSGKHLLIATVPFEWGEPDKGWTGKITVMKEILVGVMGESALLKLFAIPSFLIIPGFIGVIIWGLLWKWGLFKTKQDTGEFPLEFSEKPTNPQFWVAAITISIPVIGLYMLIINRDVLGTYGLSDLLIIWLASVIFLGVGGYSVIIGGHRLHMRRITPSEDDEPIDILKKLFRQGLGVFLAQVEFHVTENGSQKTYRAFLLQKRKNDRVASWVGPAIKVAWEKGVKQEIKDEVDNQRKSGGNPGTLAKCLEKAGKKVSVKWKTPNPGSKDIKEPREIPTADMQYVGEDSIVEV